MSGEDILYVFRYASGEPSLLTRRSGAIEARFEPRGELYSSEEFCPDEVIGDRKQFTDLGPFRYFLRGQVEARLWPDRANWSTIEPRGGESFFRSMVMHHFSPGSELPSHENDGPSLRQVARVLLTCTGALEIILMLADVGPTSTEDLVPAVVDDDTLIQAVAELRRCELVSLEGKTVTLTDRGRSAVAKLRKSSEKKNSPDA